MIERVIVGVPLELFNEIACPEEPAKLVQAAVEFVQPLVVKLASRVPGATVYG